jgi:K+-sensing histidine kinase KdpD
VKSFFKNTYFKHIKNSVGLGLTISKGIDLMSGTISYESKLNQNSPFHISIPLPLESNGTNLMMSKILFKTQQ